MSHDNENEPLESARVYFADILSHKEVLDALGSRARKNAASGAATGSAPAASSPATRGTLIIRAALAVKTAAELHSKHGGSEVAALLAGVLVELGKDGER